jgi:hypothetical protein
MEPELFPVKIINNTDVDVEFIDETRLIPRRSEKTVLIPEPSGYLNSGFKVYYHLELLGDMYLSVPRTENIIIGPAQDTAPPINSVDIDFRESFLVLQNNSKETITLNQNSSAVVYINPLIKLQPGRTWQESPYLEPGARGLYDKLTKMSGFLIEMDMYKRIALNPVNVKPSFLYTYSFDGASVVLTDARPLRRIGEKGWVKPLGRAIDMPRLAEAGGTINVLSSAETGIEYSAFAASDGTETGKTGAAGEDAFVYALIAGQGGSFIAAGSSGSGDADVPLLWKKTNEGMERIPFPASYRNARFFTLAQNDSAILAAGSALKEGKSGDYTAYLRALRDEGTRVTALWELGPEDLDGRYGEVRSAMYDTKNEIWRAIGEMLEYDNLGNLTTGSYLMEIDSSGVVLKTLSPFEGLSFYKITGGDDGSYYLIGEEEKGGESGAMVIKYDESGRLLWRQKTPLPVFSYYTDAVLTEDGSRIVLAGTMRAREADGTGGVPFIQGIDAATGDEAWRSELTDRDFQGASLASAVAKAPEYGYAVALCGVAGGSGGKPYLIARLNERGLLLK